MKIRVSHYEFGVRWFAEGDGDDCNGTWSPKDLEIAISTRISPEFQQTVFYHELVHCFYWAYSWGKKLKEEQVCLNLGFALAQFHTDNPNFAEKFLATHPRLTPPGQIDRVQE